MSDKSVEDKIKNLVIEVLDLEINPENLESNGLIEAYGLNSVDALELLMHIENDFDIEIEEEDLTSELVDSISHLAAYVQARMST